MPVATPKIPIGGRDHAVQFYENDAELAATVGQYLGDALRAGAVAIVIATETHRQAFQSQLDAADAAARADGRLLWLDAAATLGACMPGGRIDEAAFQRVIGLVFEQAAQGGKPVCAYGEMVALLWDAGDVLGAIELERLWNELGRELSFSLLCAYRHQSVSGPEHAHAFRQVCQLHSSVLGRGIQERDRISNPAEISGHFDADLDSPGAARHLLVRGLRDWGADDALLRDAELVLSELATNAVIHARTAFSVAARRGRSGLRISVRDSSPVWPTVNDPGPSVPSGRGLRVVSGLATSWGAEVTPEGKTVWAELPA